MKTPLNKNQTILAFVILGIFAILVAAASWFYITQYAYPEDDNSSKVVKQDKDSEGGAADEDSVGESESGWDLYSNKSYRYSFKYPSDLYSVTTGGNLESDMVDLLYLHKTSEKDKIEYPGFLALSVYSKDSAVSLKDWIEGSDGSSGMLIYGGNIQEARIADRDGFSFWEDGYSRFDSYGVSSKSGDLVYVITQRDSTDKNFDKVLGSFQLTGGY